MVSLFADRGREYVVWCVKVRSVIIANKQCSSLQVPDILKGRVLVLFYTGILPLIILTL